ncbi:ABC transporter permease [Blastococcus sp. PRF04-17]|uniref:ABC transporter permease n=1 Tax=Blastococcus sp. PRF04-17 TaxID=2933797 RepID=UPI001FF0FE5A|nr:ABC transporter permease [Blastococcus sp. PRF04-17]UOY01704.1 ABC transporter permease [Blastococcus sp. PRF04-17]
MTAPVLTEPDAEAPVPRGRLFRLLRGLLPYVLAIVAAFVVSGIVIAALGYDAMGAFRTILTTSFRTDFGFTETLTKWVPLTLLALGFTIPLAVGRFNIGGEGQLLVGATASAGVGIVYADLPMAVLLPMVVVAGVLAGVVWAGIAAFLMGRFGVNEILSTVLLNFVSFQVVDYAATEVWSDPAAGVAATQRVGLGAVLPDIGGPPGVHAGILLAGLVALATIVVTRGTAAGFELRAAGTNPRAAGINGIRVEKVAVIALIVGGALGGLAGALEVSGVHSRAIEGMQSNFLLLGIIIGLIARGSALWVPVVAFGIAILEVGASSMQRTVGVPAEMVLIIEALILIFLLLSDVIAARLARRAA